jgi:hypothetical protein
LISSDSPETALLGIHIYMGGIGLQQFFVLGFTALVVRFHYKMKPLDGSTAWKRPLYIMYASIALITVCLKVYLPRLRFTDSYCADPHCLPPRRVFLGVIFSHHDARSSVLLP